MTNDAFMDALRLGGALEGELIVDIHAHMGPWHNFRIPHHSPRGMVERMDQLGIAMCICSPHLAIGPGYREGNRQVMAAADQYPGRILPYVTVNPNYPEAEIREEIEHWHSQGRVRAFKIHPACHSYKVDGPGYALMFEYAREHSLPVLSHSWVGDTQAGATLLSRMASEMPTVTFIVGHAASSWSMIDEACREARERDNVMVDLTGSQLLYMALETMVERVGAEKILFGTDQPFIDPAPGLGRVLAARISDEDKRLILGLNAKRVFRL